MCGKSKSKPFCDGTHAKIRFDGTEIASQAPYLIRARKIEGPDLKLTDVPDLCNHAGFCLRASGIGNLTRSSDDAEAKRLAIEEAGNCTSGRLVAWHKESEKSIEPEFEPSIALVEEPHKGCSGPLWVRGNVPVASSDGSSDGGSSYSDHKCDDVGVISRHPRSKITVARLGVRLIV